MFSFTALATTTLAVQWESELRAPQPQFSPTVPGLTAGKCMNSQDEPLLDQLQNDIDKCMQTSQDEQSFVSCMSADGFTMGCVGCVADFVGCVMDKCDSECQEEGQACDKCISQKCEPGLDDCAGFPPQLSLSTGGKCMNSQDEPLLDQLQNDIDKCMETAQDEQSFVSCLSADGFTSGCVGCVTDFVGCVMDECDSECQEESDACDKCVAQKCEPGLDSCAGFPPQSFLFAPQAAGKCMNSQDEPLLDHLQNDIEQCMDTAQDEQSFVSCMSADGFTSGCVGCVTDFVGCVMDKCDSECQEEGAACDKCISQKCEPTLDSCAGFPPQLGFLSYKRNESTTDEPESTTDDQTTDATESTTDGTSDGTESTTDGTTDGTTDATESTEEAGIAARLHFE